MSDAFASADRREQILGDLAEGLHAVFKEAQRRTLEAEDNDEFIRLSGALHKLARSLRQSLALHARFEAERRKGAPETADQPAPAPPAAVPPLDPQDRAVASRKAFITRGVERCVWGEYDREDADEEATADSLLRDLRDRLDDLACDDGFLLTDIDTLIAQFCREFGVAPPERPTRAQLPAAVSPANGYDRSPPDTS